MALIVVMEDDVGTRMMVASVLKRDGHEVLGAEDGERGLALVRQCHPDLIVSDIQMPGLNGIQMLEALRQDPVCAAIPVILLTSLQERAHMRIGMTTGADDYITKPFRPGELREAVHAQLNKRAIQESLHSMAIDAAVQSALVEQKHQLAKLYEERLASELSERWPTGDGSAGDERLESATVLVVDLANHSALAELLNADELTDLVKKVYGNANDTIQLFGARHIRFVGEGMVAVFAATTDTHTVNHALRAVRAAVGLIESGRGIGQYLASRYPGRELPPFALHVAMHIGSVTLTVFQDPLHGSAAQVIPVGDAVGAAMLLQRRAQALGWPIAASAAALRAVTGAVRTGQRALLELPGRTAPMDAIELIGLAL